MDPRRVALGRGILQRRRHRVAREQNRPANTCTGMSTTAMSAKKTPSDIEVPAAALASSAPTNPARLNAA